MHIRPFAQGRAFDPDAIRAMATAFKDACRRLELCHRDSDSGAPEIVAKRVIEIAQGGERDPIRLTNAVLESFKLDK